VLGNGQQRKSYLHVDDCINAITMAIEKSNADVNIYNLGSRHACTVLESINWICKELHVNPTLEIGTSARGWIGDNPLIHLKTERIETLGWEPKFTIQESVVDTVRYMTKNHWIFQ
jgi:UDP-glucose 4-epimerase